MAGGRLLLNAAPGIPLLGPSGASAHLRGVAGALRPEAVIVAREVDQRGRHGAVDVPVVACGVPGWPSWLDRWRDLTEVAAARRVARVATLRSPSLVWERHALYSDAGWKVRAATGCRWILEVNAPLVEERRRYETVRRLAFARAWERDVLRAAPEVVAVSRWLTDWVRQEVGNPRVIHLPNGVAAHRGDRDGARAALGLTGRFVLGFLGSLKPWHGVAHLPPLLDALPDAVGLVVGDGPVAVTHPRLLRVGQVDEARTADLVAAMDVGLAPYGPDAPPWFCPLKVLAYRAQGTPVVATDTGDCRELVGEGGSIVTVAELADACLAWRGRRAIPWLRSWETVVAEALAPRAGHGGSGVTPGGVRAPSFLA